MVPVGGQSRTNTQVEGNGQPSVEQEYSGTIHLERYVEQILAPLSEKFKRGGRE
jgi:hypothetical protein